MARRETFDVEETQTWGEAETGRRQRCWFDETRVRRLGRWEEQETRPSDLCTVTGRIIREAQVVVVLQSGRLAVLLLSCLVWRPTPCESVGQPSDRGAGPGAILPLTGIRGLLLNRTRMVLARLLFSELLAGLCLHALCCLFAHGCTYLLAQSSEVGPLWRGGWLRVGEVGLRLCCLG